MDDIEMKPVNSSFIKAVGYDANNRWLVTNHNDGTSIIYKEVPEHIYTGILEAESVGKYFHANIRGKFEFQKSGQ